jgi:hypothetical protein
MIYRTSNGELIEIKKYSFSNDKLYYKKIMEVKDSFTKSFVSSTNSDKTFHNKNRK